MRTKMFWLNLCLLLVNMFFSEVSVDDFVSRIVIGFFSKGFVLLCIRVKDLGYKDCKKVLQRGWKLDTKSQPIWHHLRLFVFVFI